jgi:hypothetical protein
MAGVAWECPIAQNMAANIALFFDKQLRDTIYAATAFDARSDVNHTRNCDWN